MLKEHQTIKIWKTTLRNLRQIYAVTGVPMIQILDELITKEVKRIEETKSPIDTREGKGAV